MSDDLNKARIDLAYNRGKVRAGFDFAEWTDDERVLLYAQFANDFADDAIEMLDEALAQVDRLGQALANLNPLTYDSIEGAWGWLCENCGEFDPITPGTKDDEPFRHAPDCIYVWAVEHDKKRDGQ